MKIFIPFFRFNFLILIVVSGIGCAKKLDPKPTVTTISVSDANAVLNSLDIATSSTKLSGSMPSSSYSSYAPSLSLGSSSSYVSAIAGGSLTLPFRYSSNYIFQGIYLTVYGASSYIKVPFSSSSSSTYYSGTGEVDITLPSNISSGTFTINYSGYDSYGYVSSSISRQVTVGTSSSSSSSSSSSTGSSSSSSSSSSLGTGSYTFNGTSYTGTALASYTSALGNQYSITSSNGTSFIISFGPSSGSSSVSSAYYTGGCTSSCSTAAQFTSAATYNSYYATGGTVSKSGNTITFNLTMKLISSSSSSSYSLSGSMTI